MQIAARQFARDRSQGDPDPIGHTQTVAILPDRLFSWSVRRYVEVRGWSVPLVAASMASGSLFVSVAWWMVGLELTLIIDRWWVLFLLTLLLGFLISAIALVARMLFRRPTVHKFLLVGSQVAIQCTDSIRMPVGEWLKRWSARGGLMIPLPPWLRLMIGWAVATTAFFLLFVVFSALGYELLYHPPQVFSPALWFMNLLALVIVSRAHYDFARLSFSRNVAIAWGIVFSIADACLWSRIQPFIVMIGAYLYLFLEPTLQPHHPRSGPLHFWICLLFVVAIFGGAKLARSLKPGGV